MEFKKLGDIFKISSGGTPSKKNNEYYENGDIAWVKTGDLKSKYIQESSEYITELGLENSSAKLFPKKTVLISMYGATIGATSILKIDATTNQACAAFLPNDEVIPEYLYYFFKANYEKIVNLGVGGAQPNISATILKDIKIPYINLNEQSKIVEVLDKAQELIDKRKEQIEALDELVKSRFIEMFGDTNDYVSVSEYIESLTAGKSLAGEFECLNKVLNTGSVSYDYYDETQVKNLPLDYVPKKEHLVNEGDVLISRMNTAELVGATAYVWKSKENIYIPDRLWKANFKPNVNPIFVWQLLIQRSTKEQIRKIASGTSGSMKNISKSGLLGIEVINVDINKQNEFADFVKQVDKLKSQMETSLKELEANFNSLMQKAFKGELF